MSDDELVRLNANVGPATPRKGAWARMWAALRGIDQAMEREGYGARDIVDMTKDAVKGALTEKASNVAVNFTEAELNEVRLEKMLRQGEADDMIKESEAAKAQIDVEIAKEELLKIQADRLQSQVAAVEALRRLGVACRFGEDGKLYAGPTPVVEKLDPYVHAYTVNTEDAAAITTMLHSMGQSAAATFFTQHHGQLPPSLPDITGSESAGDMEN